MSRLLNLLFPPRCVLCRGEITGETQICSNCAEELQGQCQVRQREPVEGCTQAVSVLLYQGKVRRALLTCKYGKKMVIGKWGGGQIAACLRHDIPQWKPNLITKGFCSRNGKAVRIALCQHFASKMVCKISAQDSLDAGQTGKCGLCLLSAQGVSSHGKAGSTGR